MNSPAHPDQSRKAKQRLLTLLILAVVVGMGLVGLFALLLRQSGQTAAEEELHPTVVPATAIVPTTSVPPALSASPTPPARAPDKADIVAIINGREIAAPALYLIMGVDRAMAALLGQPIPSEDALDRLVNDELVLQAATKAGFSVPETEVEQALAAFLKGKGIDEQTLSEEALAAQGVSLSDFRTYFGQLLLIDRFAREQAAAEGISLAAYIARLQEQAHISYGAIAEIVTATPPISPTPSSAQAITTPLVSLPEENAEAILEQLAAGDEAEITPTVVLAEKRGLAVGQLAPDFSLPLLGSEGTEMMAWSDLLGQPTVLSFWTTWCPYCRRQTPNLIAGYEQWASTGVQFVGIDVKEAAGTVAAYVAQSKIPYPILLDTEGNVAEKYNVRGFPTTLFLDAEGRVLLRQIGVLTRERLNQWIIEYQDAN
ncbi:MAG: redoxin domain-containing protein [Chloroflexi bacterium]|nr:redoxin domain-containing protein [Chloroflexota bacterium]